MPGNSLVSTQEFFPFVSGLPAPLKLYLVLALCDGKI